MKKLLFIIALFFCLFGCAEDNNTEILYTQSDLAGTWLISKTVYEGTEITSRHTECDKKENIVIDGQGNAVWKFTAGANDECLSATYGVKTVILETETGNSFNITNLLQSAYYTGRFLSKSKIKINQFYELGNSTTKTEKEFIKQ